MKYLLLCVIMTKCHGMAIGPKSLEAPNDISVKTQDTPQVIDITWSQIESPDKDDPVLGYKVQIVEVKKVKRIINMFDLKTQELVSQELEEYPAIDSKKVPEGNSTVLTIPVDKRFARHNYVTCVLYEMRVRAFTKKQEGPWSNHVRVKVNDH